jgi:flagellar FliL protein
MSEEKAESAAPVKAPNPMKLVIVGAAALFVALVGAQVAVPLINNMLGGGGKVATAETGEEGHAEEAVEEKHDDSKPLAEAQYIALDPPFVVSFDQPDGARYLQLQLQAMARDQGTIAAIKQHAPAIRNAFLFLLSGYELEALASQAGKEELRLAMLGSANEILKKNRVAPPMEDLYFTSLVVQ